MWTKSPYKKRFPEGEVGMTKLWWGILTVAIGLMSSAAPSVSAVESSCLERCVVEHPQYGFPQCRELGDSFREIPALKSTMIACRVVK